MAAHRELGDLAGAGTRNVADLDYPIRNVAGRGAGAKAGPDLPYKGVVEVCRLA